MDVGQIAASSVLGAFALITARNSLKQSNDLRNDIKDDATIPTLSSNSVASEDHSLRQGINLTQLKTLKQELNNTVQSSYDVIKKVSEVTLNSTPTFNFMGRTKESSQNMIFLEKSPASVDIIVGAAKTGEGLSVITSSDNLLRSSKALQTIGNEKLASVWHVGCNNVDFSSLKLYSDFSIVESINFPILLSSTAQEVHDFGILAEVVSSLTSTPIAHLFDGVSAQTQQTTINSKILNFPKYDSTDKLTEVFNRASQDLFGKPFRSFDFFGPADAEVVFVSFGPISQVFLNVADRVEEIGVLNVKLFKPFSAEELINALPSTTKRICVVDYTPNANQILYSEVTAALWNSKFEIEVFSTIIDSYEVTEVDENVITQVISNATATIINKKLTITKAEAHNFEEKVSLIGSSSAIGSIFGRSNQGSVFDNKVDVHEISFWLNETQEVKTKSVLTKFKSVQVSNKLDTVTGAKRVDMRLSKSFKAVEDFTQFSLNKAEVSVAYLTSNLTYFAAKSVKPQGKLIFIGDSDHFDALKLTQTTKNYIYEHNLSVFYVKESTKTLLEIALNEDEAEKVNIFEFKTSSLEIESKIEDFVSRRRSLPSSYKQKQSNKVESYKLAWNILFKESYNVQQTLRPSEHGVGTATVTKFERLTPDEYNRNIFHIEFDISKTDLTYEIGDALGVFGENDPTLVDDFIQKYNFKSGEIVTLQSRGNMKEEEIEFVSVRNLLLKKLDLFGKVQKRFYVELAKFASSRYEKLKLLHTGTDDSEQFKLGGYETVTYAELLLQYTSCTLTIQDLIELIPEIKARHYSISSSMKMSPTSVHLLVVAVDWVTPLGKTGEGQCTRFLKNLTVGQEVCVDIQKSVLRLPPNPEQPIVMAGLGTGMAPFRAFVQQRYFMKRMGHKIGPMVLYFGARHKAQEWLYGAELEKYEKMGLLRLGLAWSRDQKDKVYIQHKIQQDSKLLKEYLKDQKGYFYLCGPTWPVPDVRDAINSGLEDDEAVEKLKEQGRYILEVY